MNVMSDNPHTCTVRYMCRACKEPVGFPPPPVNSWVCTEDGGLPVQIPMDDVVKMVELDLLHDLWSLSRSSKLDIDGKPVGRQTWVAHAYVKRKPEHGCDTAIYKAMDRLGIGDIAHSSEVVKARDLNVRFRKGLAS